MREDWVSLAYLLWLASTMGILERYKRGFNNNGNCHPKGFCVVFAGRTTPNVTDKDQKYKLHMLPLIAGKIISINRRKTLSTTQSQWTQETETSRHNGIYDSNTANEGRHLCCIWQYKYLEAVCQELVVSYLLHLCLTCYYTSKTCRLCEERTEGKFCLTTRMRGKSTRSKVRFNYFIRSNSSAFL